MVPVALEGQDVYLALEDAIDEFLNVSGKNFIDISSELYRVYEYPDGTEVTIYEPLLLNVSESGGHRIYDFYNTSHYIVPGFVHIYWGVRDGEPNFVA